MNWLGLDIGGANLKVADGISYADAHGFALWRDRESLAQRLRLIIAQAPRADHLVVTMTGELADCFETKSEGVRFILDSVEQAADGRHTRVYLSTGKMVTPEVARRRPAEVAAANWHALAAYLAGLVGDRFGLVVDVGSTTTDVIPIVDGQIVAQGRNDTDRLMAGELVYFGVERTPVCALLAEVPYRDGVCPVARELFATTQDAFLILGDLPENSTSNLTADGRAATKPCARTRLSRMVCADDDLFNHRDAVAIAQTVADAGMGQLMAGIQRVVSNVGREPEVVIAAGAGEFIIRRAIHSSEWEPQLVSFAQQYGTNPSRCAPAHAVAALARETTTP